MSTVNLVGQSLSGRYRIQSLIGQGGMASVYKAYDLNLRRDVAIKIIHPHLSSNPDFFRRFEDEATTVARLHHPNIVQVYDFSHDGELYYMVMEFVIGETIKDRLEQLKESGGRLSIDEIIKFTADICDAANYAHLRGMIHRDIKPANIMLDVDGRVILMDFGIVRMVDAFQHTATGTLLGTAIYMSPEQIQGLQIDARSDIYSIGIILFEMLTGKPPFEANSVMALMMKQLNDPVPDIREFNPDAPPELVEITNKALAKNYAERFQTAGEMAGALGKLSEQLKKARWAVSQPARAGLGSLEETIVEPMARKGTGDTIIEAPVSSTPATAASRPASQVVIQDRVQPSYQAAPVEQAGEPGQILDTGIEKTLPARIPAGRRKSKAWIPVLSILLILIVGGGGYFAYTKFVRGGVFAPSPSPSAQVIVLPPATSTSVPTFTPSFTIQATATDTVLPSRTPPRAPTATQRPSGSIPTGWIIVVGAFEEYNQAVSYTERFRNAGYSTAVYYRNSYYRVVIPGYASEEKAQNALPGVQSINPNAYLRELSDWCPYPSLTSGYITCK